MATDVKSLIEVIYNCSSIRNNIYRYGKGARYNTVNKFMEIPINEDTFELPVFALPYLVKLTDSSEHLNLNTLIAEVYVSGSKSTYKTVDSNLKFVLKESKKSRLIQVSAGESYLETYYCTHGAVFDYRLMPKMLCSWIIKTVYNEDSFKYRFIQPVLRVDKHVYLNKKDSMEKWIVNRMMKECMSTKVKTPFRLDLSRVFENSTESMDIKIELFDNPFNMDWTDTPSVYTTPEKLLKTVKDHINDKLYVD